MLLYLLVMPTLVLTPRFTEDSQALWRAAGHLGWSVERLRSFRLTEPIKSNLDLVFYVEALVAQTIAEQCGYRLDEIPLDWLPRLPEEHRKRSIESMKFREARKLTQPAFMKPPNDKSFPARVYLGSELPDGYDEESDVLVSEIVTWEKEFRCFVLDRKPMTLSVYLRDGQLQRQNEFAATDTELHDAEQFIRSVLADGRVDFPKAAVMDVGVMTGKGWAMIEANAAWGSGIYGCDPVKVLETIRHTAVRI